MQQPIQKCGCRAPSHRQAATTHSVGTARAVEWRQAAGAASGFLAAGTWLHPACQFMFVQASISAVLGSTGAARGGTGQAVPEVGEAVWQQMGDVSRCPTRLVLLPATAQPKRRSYAQVWCPAGAFTALLPVPLDTSWADCDTDTIKQRSAAADAELCCGSTVVHQGTPIVSWPETPPISSIARSRRHRTVLSCAYESLPAVHHSTPNPVARKPAADVSCKGSLARNAATVGRGSGGRPVR